MTVQQEHRRTYMNHVIYVFLKAGRRQLLFRFDRFLGMPVLAVLLELQAMISPRIRTALNV